ncbi:TolC family protein [Marinospirillum minutulum]|uniref:TolC family protein n=1 Tax=Marinospirillum minutulum TaxID=64974 RepID=UPI000408885F|nr:TolC family protein [Marinospirillum minutulum]
MRIFFLLIALGLAACSSTPDEVSKDIVTLPELGDEVTSVNNTAEVSTKNPTIQAPNDVDFNLWWRYTGNRELEVLIDRAITNSQNLQIAAQRVVQAKARYLQAKAQGLPLITAQTSYNLEAPLGGIGSVPRGGTPRQQKELEVGLTGSYTLDLWGQRKSLSESADLKLRQAVFQYDAQLLDLISRLAKSYFQYLSLNDRIGNTKETEKALTSMLLAMEDRYRLGDATVVEMQIQRSAIFSTRVRLPTLLKERQQLRYEIAHLMGIAPGTLQLSDAGLKSIALPKSVQGISTAHLLRRPDIRTIESGMLAADADLDVACKALLPGLTLAADLSSGVRNPADLFQPNTLIWNALGTLSATVFDGGAKEQEVKFAQAVRNELIESYVNTVHNGLLAARTAVTELEYSGERLAMQQESAKAAKVAQDFGFESYSVGGIDFLTFLDSMESYQERQDNLYQLELEYYQAFVDFYSALGGGIPYREISENNPVFKTNQKQDALFESSTLENKALGWLEKPQEFTASPWLVKLAGVFDRFAIEALMRDLPRRYASLQPAETLIVEQVGVNIPTPAGDAVWYSVNFTGFEQEQDAVAWCQMLRSKQQRCTLYKPKENFEYIGWFSVNEIEKQSHLLGESFQALHLNADQETGEGTRQAIDYTEYGSNKANQLSSTEFGRLYSLLKIEADQAWLIDNRTYAIQAASVGEMLAFGSQLKKASSNRAIVTYQNNDYLLRPIYSFEGVEKSPDGQLIARIHSGGQEDEVYYHRVGDSLYGGGLIQAITAKQISIDWKGTQISLPIME